MTNCLNCGAPFDVNQEKCLYCGTSYYDMSALDLNSNKPFMLKIKTTMNGSECYITQLVRVLPQMSIEMSTETVDVMDGRNVPIMSYISNRSVTTNLTFQAVPRQKNNSLCTIVVKEN